MSECKTGIHLHVHCTTKAHIHCSPTHQEVLIELKVAWVLPCELMDTVQPLEEDRALLVHIISGQPAPLTKLVAVAKPLSLYKYFETLWI